MSVELTGLTPLWPDIHVYLMFLTEHQDEVYEHYVNGDENAAFLVEAITEWGEGRIKNADVWRNSLKVVTERYIHDYHPEIATIKGGYPKEVQT